MATYLVSFSFQKGSSSMNSTISVEAESDSSAMKIAEGLARKRNPNRHDYKFMVTKVVRR